MKRIFSTALAAIKRGMFVLKTAFAVPTVMGYPITMMAGLALFIYAFRGDFLIFLLWVAIFAAFTVALVAVSFIKRKGLSLGLAIFFIFCQVVILGFACSMAFTQFYQVTINILTFLVLLGFVSAQISLWWLRRHFTEVWVALKTWFAKLFTRRTLAPAHGPVIGALGGVTPTPATHVAGTLGGPPPP